MFCNKCGSQISDGAKFCPKCGQVSQQPVQPEQGMPDRQGRAAVPAAPANYKKVGMIVCGAAVLIIAIVIIIMASSGGGYKAAVKKYYKAIENRDGDKLTELFPDDLVEMIYDNSWYSISRSEVKLAMQYYVDRRMEDYENQYGRNIKIKYTIEDAESAADEVYEMNSEIRDAGYGFRVTDAYELDVTVEIKGKDGAGYEGETIYMIKIDGTWYLVAENYSNSYFNYFY